MSDFNEKLKEFMSKGWSYSTGGGATRSDWNQNDETAADYVKNRTHWEEFSAIVEEQTIEGFSVMEDPIYAVQNPFVFTPAVGDKYIVHWDGDEYNVDAKELDGMICIGNENYVNMISGGDIPFAIIFAGSDVFVSTESTAASHTICIEGEVVHKLDKKYLPDDIGGGSIMYCGGNNDDDDVHLFHFDFDTGEIGAAVTREELVAAIKHGAIYIALIDENSVRYKLATFVYFDNNYGYIGTFNEEYFYTAEFNQSNGPR